MSGDVAFQMVLGYMHYMPALILENHFLDMNTLPHIDLTQPWWVDGFHTNATINTELCGAALEALNYESYQLVTPAYFETTLQAKYARDEDSQEMMEIIRDSLYFDFASIWESKSPTMKANLEKLLTFFRE